MSVLDSSSVFVSAPPATGKSTLGNLLYLDLVRKGDICVQITAKNMDLTGIESEKFDPMPTVLSQITVRLQVAGIIPHDHRVLQGWSDLNVIAHSSKTKRFIVMLDEAHYLYRTKHDPFWTRVLKADQLGDGTVVRVLAFASLATWAPTVSRTGFR